MAKDSGWVNNVADLIETKTGKLQLKFKKDIVLKKGDKFNLEKFKDSIDKLVAAGVLDEETAAERKTWNIKYVCHKTPSDDAPKN